MKNIRKTLHSNNLGSASFLETLVSVGIAITLVITFSYSLNTSFTVNDDTGADLEAKTIGVMETILNSAGRDTTSNPDWEEDPEFSSFGLATNPTIEYGIIKRKQGTDEWSMAHGPFPKLNIGIVQTCFLAGTKIVMADESYKNIEDIIVGDIVKSFDEEKNIIVNKKATHVFHHTPEEMSDYYLVINNQLRVTPNHLFYINSEWIRVDDLKVGDSLFYPTSNYKIYSIEKIFERTFTYNFEVEGNHNYFVAMKTENLLVHNQQTEEPGFIWTDEDGLESGTNIFFRASPEGVPGGEWLYKWYLDDDPNPVLKLWNDNTYELPNLGNSPHTVKLELHIMLSPPDNPLNQYHGYTVTKTVQANKVGPFEGELTPWIASGKDTHPGDEEYTLSSYGGEYYVEYDQVDSVATYDYFLYEVKEKTSSDRPILDIDKIIKSGTLNVDEYNKIKKTLGLESDRFLYNFYIEISIQGGNYYIIGTKPVGADVVAQESTTQNVIVYSPPGYGGAGTISGGPIYRVAEVTVSIFLGAT